MDILPEDNQDVIYKTNEGDIGAGYYDATNKVFIVGWEGALGWDLEDIDDWFPLDYAYELCKISPDLREW